MTSSPHCAQSNVFAERQVRWIKPIVKRCIKTGENIQQALLHVRGTPIDAKLLSPAELLKKRNITTNLQSHLNNMSDETIKNRLEERSVSIKMYYDLNDRKEDVPPLYPRKNDCYSTPGRYTP